MIRSGVVEATILEQLESSFVHVLDVVDNLPEYAFEAWRTREAAPVYPSLAEVDVREQPLQVEASISDILIWIVEVIARKLVLFDDFVHELLEVIHESDLIPRQHVLLVLGYLE